MTSPIFLPVDRNFGSRIVVDERHAAIHAGRAFVASHMVSVGTATVASILISVPSTAAVAYHMAIEVNSRVSASLAIALSEAPNASGGTAVASYNLNRLSANTSGVVVTHTPTYVSSGTVLENQNMGVTASGDRGGLLANGNVEYLLNRDTLYLVRVTAYTAASSVCINARWYETGN